MTFPSFWRSGCVTCFAGRRGRLIEEDGVSADNLFERMTRGTCYVFMPSLERKCRLVMIEKRRPPLDRIVATCAVGTPCTELVSVRVLMAIAAIYGGFREVHVLQ